MEDVTSGNCLKGKSMEGYDSFLSKLAVALRHRNLSGDGNHGNGRDLEALSKAHGAHR
jgi:hypothetical protein